MRLIELALERSYNLPIDVFDSLGIISLADIELLLGAAMGFSQELLQKKIENFKESS